MQSGETVKKPEIEAPGRTNHEAVLHRLLEGRGDLPAFDKKLVEVLRAVQGSPSRSAIAGAVLRKAESAALSAAPPSAGAVAVVPSMMLGKWYVTTKTAETLTAEVAQGSEAVRESLKTTLAETLKAVSLDEGGWFDSLARGANSVLRTAVGKVEQALDQSWSRVDGTVSDMMRPLIDHVANFAGSVAQYPAGMIGFMAVGAMAGATAGAYSEWRRSVGFEQVAGLIEASERRVAAGRDRVGEGPDPRLELIAAFDGIEDSPSSLRISREEWMRFAGAVRAARADILREQTQAPRIVADEIAQASLSAQEEIVKDLIAGERELAGLDLEIATSILDQFERNVAGDAQGARERQERESAPLRQVARYARAVARGYAEGTGIPFILRTTRKIARAAWSTRRLAGIP